MSDNAKETSPYQGILTSYLRGIIQNQLHTD